MPKPNDFLPVASHTYHILLALTDRVLHGYSIIKEIRVRTNNDVIIGTSTLYATLGRLFDDGLVAEASRPAGTELDDARRKYYRITKLGLSVARAEASRVRQLDQMAVAKKLVPANRGK